MPVAHLRMYLTHLADVRHDRQPVSKRKIGHLDIFGNGAEARRLPVNHCARIDEGTEGIDRVELLAERARAPAHPISSPQRRAPDTSAFVSMPGGPRPAATVQMMVYRSTTPSVRPGSCSAGPGLYRQPSGSAASQSAGCRATAWVRSNPIWTVSPVLILSASDAGRSARNLSMPGISKSMSTVVP